MASVEGSPPVDADRPKSAGVRFKVSRAADSDNKTEQNDNSKNGKHEPQQRGVTFQRGDDGGEVLPLFYDEEGSRPHVGRMFRSMSIYNPMVPSVPVADTEAKPPKAESKLNTFMGVYLPCMQNIFGVLFFIRLTWIVGTAGVLQSFVIVLICCTVTFLTVFSLSAIATNGIVPAGGPYYMISRNLGPELGGCVGILFYLGTTIAGAMYVIGAVEIVMLYLIPAMKIFPDDYMCFRLYGTILLMLLGCIVLAGVKVVSKFALPAVCIVVLCILGTFVGGAVNFNGNQRLTYCLVGDRLVDVKTWAEKGNGMIECNGTELDRMFCTGPNNTEPCDRYYMKQKALNRIGYRNGIKGIASGVFLDNMDSKYYRQGYILSRNTSKEPVHRNEQVSPYYVISDVTTGFMILIGVFFPSCTGIMAGSNRSGDLQDASRSIPLGTLGAQVTTSIVYLAGVLLFGASIDEMFIRDKFGASAYGRLSIAELAVPTPTIILIGCFASTVGAGMQSLTGAPRLLQAIAKDDVIPILSPFARTDGRGEPIIAIFMTLAICEIGILIAQIEKVTALITQFFLLCYLSVNVSCALQSLLNSPNWRPRFRFYHWSVSTCGALLCVAVMFVSHWVFALIAIAIGFVVYKYIEFRGAEKEWGDGLRGLGLSAARYALLNLEDKPPHTKNWRPQILVLAEAESEDSKIPEDVHIARLGRLLDLVGQLKAGKGLTLLASVIKGDFVRDSDRASTLKLTLHGQLLSHKLKGFCEVIMTPDRLTGVSALVQTSGLGALRHNTVVATWPDGWREEQHKYTTVHEFVDTIRIASAANCAIFLPKNLERFPLNNERMTGTLDVWWVVHDGGMLMLLPFLLQQNKVWAKTRLRIFAVAQVDDNSVKMKQDLNMFLYHLRINAEVDVIEMMDSDISEYTYERTLRMEQRYELVRGLHIANKAAKLDPQVAIVDAATHRRKQSRMAGSLSLPDVAATAAAAGRAAAAAGGGDNSRADVDGVKPSDAAAAQNEALQPLTTGQKLENGPTREKASTDSAAAPTTPATAPPTIFVNDDAGEEGAEGASLSPLPAAVASANRLSTGNDEDEQSAVINATGPAAQTLRVGLKSSNVRRMHTAVKLNEVGRTSKARSAPDSKYGSQPGDWGSRAPKLPEITATAHRISDDATGHQEDARISMNTCSQSASHSPSPITSPITGPTSVSADTTQYKRPNVIERPDAVVFKYDAGNLEAESGDQKSDRGAATHTREIIISVVVIIVSLAALGLIFLVHWARQKHVPKKTIAAQGSHELISLSYERESPSTETHTGTRGRGRVKSEASPPPSAVPQAETSMIAATRSPPNVAPPAAKPAETPTEPVAAATQPVKKAARAVRSKPSANASRVTAPPSALKNRAVGNVAPATPETWAGLISLSMEGMGWPGGENVVSAAPQASILQKTSITEHSSDEHNGRDRTRSQLPAIKRSPSPAATSTGTGVTRTGDVVNTVDVTRRRRRRFREFVAVSKTKQAKVDNMPWPF